MLSILNLGLVMYLSSLPEASKLFKFESKLFQWLRAKKIFIDKMEQETVSNSNAHEILCELGETLESPELTRFEKVKNEIHPKVNEYYQRTKGLNVEVVPIQNRAELKLVK